MNRARPTPASPAHRLTVWLGLALVLALNLLAARPDWHAALHAPSDAHADCPHHGHGAAKSPLTPESDDDHGCVISAFAHGKAHFQAAPFSVAVAALAAIAPLPTRIVVAPVAPEFFVPPGCGPPLA